MLSLLCVTVDDSSHDVEMNSPLRDEWIMEGIEAMRR